MGKNRHYMDTSLDTKKKDRKRNPLFPYTVRGKKLYKDLHDTDWGKLLSKYLESEDPEDLFYAVQTNNGILQGRGINLDQQDFLRTYTKNPDHYPDPEFIDAHTVLWESVRHWEEKIMFSIGKEETRKEAEKYLAKIVGSASIPRRPPYHYHDKIGLIHVVQSEKGTKPYIIYESPYKFMELWNYIESAFQAKKKRYIDKGNVPKQLDIRKIIKSKLNEDVPEAELKRFNLYTGTTIIAGYIAWKHEKSCFICRKQPKKKKVAYRTIIDLKNKALAEIQSFTPQPKD